MRYYKYFTYIYIEYKYLIYIAGGTIRLKRDLRAIGNRDFADFRMKTNTKYVLGIYQINNIHINIIWIRFT